MALVYTPATSDADVDALPQTSFDEFLSILTNLRLAPSPVDLDLERGTLEIHGRRVILCAKEFDLLAHLASNADRTVSRDELFATVWEGAGLDSESRTVDAHIRRLRKKLEEVPGLISTVRGEGYRFNSAPGIRVKVARIHTLAA